MSVVYAIDSLDREKKVFDALCAEFATERDGSATRSLTYFDTFEWRLFRAGTTLAAWTDDGRPVTCWRTTQGRLLHRLRGLELPPFARQLPGGAFRDALIERVEMRRLLPVALLELRSRTLRVLDADGKTVTRVVFERGFASPPGNGARRRVPATLSVEPLRGYQKAGHRVSRFLQERQGLQPVEGCGLTRALAAIGRRPATVETKLELRLDAEMTAAEATRTILRRLFEIMRLNEDGMRADVDSEFLHDFRVAVRRTRSALGQIKGVLPADRSAHFRVEFKWLGTLTGPTRDMDVYLLKLPDYRALLPDELRADLDPLEGFLRRRQQTEHARLVAGLDSERYGRLVEEWPRLLEQRWISAPKAARPVVAVASARINKIFRRVLDDGVAIGPDSSAEQLHRLRIDCKKLRYLLEFFRSLCDEKSIARLVKDLKRLQDNLGDFNDYEIQRQALEGFATELAATSEASERLLLALGRLVERLRAEQDAERERFSKRFAKFASEANRRCVKQLFAEKRV